MRNYKLYSVLIIVFLINNVYGQIETAVTETTETIGDVSGSALHVRIHRASKKEILKQVKDKLKERSETVKVKGNEVYATNAMFNSISEYEIKVYAKVKEFNETEHELYLIFLNGDEIISTKTDIKDYKAAKEYLYEFANTLSRESNEYFLKVSEKKLSDLERDLERLRSNKSKDENNIVNLRKKIKDNEGEIRKLDDKENLDEKAIKTRAKKEQEILVYRKKINGLEEEIIENKKKQDESIENIKNQRELIKETKSHKELFD